MRGAMLFGSYSNDWRRVKTIWTVAIYIFLYIFIKIIKIDMVCMFLLTKYQYYIYIFSPFPPLHFGAAFSVLAFSTIAHWCRVFRSRHFHPCNLVPRFPFSPFPPLHFRRCRVFRSRLFSRPVAWSKKRTKTLPTLSLNRLDQLKTGLSIRSRWRQSAGGGALKMQDCKMHDWN